MKIDIRHIAKLSKIRIEDQEIPKFEKDMERIIGMVEQLPDISGMDLSPNPADAMQLREDVAVSDKYTRNELLANAPQVQAGCIVVPKTVE